MSVWKLEDFLAELDNMAELHKKRPNSVLAQGLWTSVCTKLTSVPHWRAQEVMRLMDKVDEIELPEELKTNMQGTLDSLVSTNLGHMKIVAGTQTLEALSPYLSKTDWSSLAECTVTSDAMLVLATRLRKLGVVQLKEGTKKQVMALLVWWHKDNIPGPWHLYHMSQEFVRLFTNLQVACHAPSQSVYPANPMSLPSVWLGQAYGAEDGPALTNLSLQPYFAKIPLRATSSLLQNKNTAAAGVQNPAVNNALVPTVENPMATDRLALALEKFMDKWQPPAMPAPAAPVPLCDMSKCMPTAVVEKVVEKPVVEKPAAPLPAAQTQLADTASLEAFEDKAMEMIAAKKESKSTSKACFKRPAAGPKKKVKKTTPVEVFGCLRCRGNVRGCDTCKNPNFKGRRFSSRHEWNEFMESKNKRKCHG